MGKAISYVSNSHCLIGNKMGVLDHWSIGNTNLLILYIKCCIYYISIIKWLAGSMFFLPKVLASIDNSNLQFILIVLFLSIWFGVLSLIKTLLIFHFFVCIYWIIIYLILKIVRGCVTKFPLWINPIENFVTHPRTIFRIKYIMIQ